MRKGYHGLMQACGLTAGLIIAVVSLVITANVLSRNLGTGSIYGTIEGSEYAIAAATFLAAPWVMYQGAHVKVDLLQHALSDRYRRRLEILISLAGALICMLFGYYLWAVAGEYLDKGTMVFKSFVFPEWWTFILPVFCFTLLTIEFLRRFWRLMLPVRG